MHVRGATEGLGALRRTLLRSGLGDRPTEATRDDVIEETRPPTSQAARVVGSHDRLQALAVLSHHLNTAMTTEDVASLIVQHADAVIDASFINVALIDEHHLMLHMTQPEMDADIAQRWSVLPLEGVATPAHDAIRMGAPVFVDRVDVASRYADMVADADRVGLDTIASLPLLDGAGQPFGALGCGWATEVDFDPNIRAQLRLLADLCSQALQRCRRTEAQDNLVQQIQEEVLAGHDAVDALDVAVGYQPAQAAIGFGGDWYDVISIDDQQTAVVVGDVAGHGIAAAAQMTATKATIRGMALTAPTKGDVFPYATRALNHLRSGYIATVGVVWVDTQANEIEWRLAGHVPPMVRTADGGVRILAGPQHPPLGMPTEPRELAPEPFPPGSALVLYTDGLVERRTVPIDERLEVLRSAIESFHETCTAAEIRDELMAQMIDTDTHDDVAVVVVCNPQKP